MNGLLSRMIRAAGLDAALYKEVGSNPGFMKEAGTVVALSSMAAGIGTFQQAGIPGVVFGMVIALLAWFIWAYLTCIIGTRLLPVPETDADYGQLLRAIGFSSSPGIIRVAGIIPGIGPVMHLVAVVWMLAAMATAVRRALDYASTMRAIAICFPGFIVQLIILRLFLSLFT